MTLREKKQYITVPLKLNLTHSLRFPSLFHLAVSRVSVQNWATNLSSGPSLSQVALVFPNNDPVAFMVAFYGCLLAEVVPVPIEVPLSRKVPRDTPPFFVSVPLQLISVQPFLQFSARHPSKGLVSLPGVR